MLDEHCIGETHVGDGFVDVVAGDVHNYEQQKHCSADHAQKPVCFFVVTIGNVLVL